MIRKTLGAIAIIVVIASIAAFAGAPRRRLSTSIFIAAPPEKIWAILTNLPAYPAWNPELTLRGKLTPGATVENIIGPGTPNAAIFYPTILTVTPGRELRWRGHMLLYRRLYLPRVFDATHDFLLTTQPGGTRFTQSEQFRGILLWLFDVEQLRPGFTAMNKALQIRAQAP